MYAIWNKISSPAALQSGRDRARVALLTLAVIGISWHVSGRTGETGTTLPPPEIDSPKGASSGPETAVLAGGCFWGVQGVSPRA